MTNEQMKKALDEAGIPYKKTSTKEELEKLTELIREQPEEPQPEADTEEVAEEVEEVVEEVVGEPVKEETEPEVAEEVSTEPEVEVGNVGYKGGECAIIENDKFLIRVYNEEDQGKGFVKLAEMFVSKQPTKRKMVSLDSIGGLKVVYNEITKSGLVVPGSTEFATKDYKKAIELKLEKENYFDNARNIMSGKSRIEVK